MRGLLGKKLSYSYSKIIHELIDEIAYDLIETDSLDLFFLSKKYDLFNVTIPYKREVINYLDDYDEVVRNTWSCNTVIRKDNLYMGYNTDYFGFEFLCKYHEISFTNLNIGIIGNGATSRVVKYYSLVNKGNTYIFARNPKDGEYHLSDISKYKIDILVNTTPIGMYPNNEDTLDIDYNILKNTKVIIDVVYNPLSTKLISYGKKHKIKSVNGLIMLVAQAVKANSLFYNKEIDNNLIIDIYKKLLLDTLNIVLIGMPLSGKSYFSKELSKKYNKEIIDTDLLIEKETNLSISEIFSKYGEAYFRKLEKDIVSKYSKLNNQIISTGGGVILDKKNIDNLSYNGVIIFIDTPLEVLKKHEFIDRPLLKSSKELEEMYKLRYNLYVEYCDILLTNDDLLDQIEVKIDEYISN